MKCISTDPNWFHAVALSCLYDHMLICAHMRTAYMKHQRQAKYLISSTAFQSLGSGDLGILAVANSQEF